LPVSSSKPAEPTEREELATLRQEVQEISNRLEKLETASSPDSLISNDARKLTSSAIPRGMRVVAIDVTVDNAFLAKLEPGDFVAVTAVRRKPRLVSQLVLPRSKVFGMRWEKDPVTPDFKQVSLLVTPEQAQELLKHTNNNVEFQLMNTRG